MDPVTVRLMEERRKWIQNTPNGFSANPMRNYNGMNLFKWECQVPGPRRTPYEGKKYYFTIEFDNRGLGYPLKIMCNSRIYHPHISSKGWVCSSLRYIWPKHGLKEILFGLQSFLEDPQYMYKSFSNQTPKKRRKVQNLSNVAAEEAMARGGDSETIYIE